MYHSDTGILVVLALLVVGFVIAGLAVLCG